MRDYKMRAIVFATIITGAAILLPVEGAAPTWTSGQVTLTDNGVSGASANFTDIIAHDFIRLGDGKQIRYGWDDDLTSSYVHNADGGYLRQTDGSLVIPASVADPGAAINAAIAALPAMGGVIDACLVAGGNTIATTIAIVGKAVTIRMCPGTYLASARPAISVAGPSSTTSLKIDGVSRMTTTLKATGATTGPLILLGDNVTVNGNWGSITGLHIDGANVAAGIYSQIYLGGIISQSSFIATTPYAVKLYQAPENLIISNRFETMPYSTDTAILMHVASGTTIMSNYITTENGVGINWTEAGSSVLIQGNILEHNTVAIDLPKVPGTFGGLLAPVIQNNFFEANSIAPIRVGATGGGAIPTGVTIIGNEMAVSGNGRLLVQEATNIAVYGNRFGSGAAFESGVTGLTLASNTYGGRRSVNTTSVIDMDTGGQILLGNDTALLRGAANEFTTPDNFAVTGDLIVRAEGSGWNKARIASSNGVLYFGDGTTSEDTQVRRSSSSVVKIAGSLDGNVLIGMSSANAPAIHLRSADAHANPVVSITSTGIGVGAGDASALDTTLSRTAANQWSVGSGDSFKVDGAYGGGFLILGAYYLWVDGGGLLRIKSGAPTSDTDGTIVGTQA